jgi:dTDP-4-amino-4,6-dideoxygalactose transaminase
MQIPFIDLKAQYESIQNEIENNLSKAFTSFQFCQGQQVNDFEIAFSKLLTTRHCISMGNGTDSLFAILKALEIKAGDEVITPAFSWISSSEVISLCGATPVFVEVDSKTYTIDHKLVEQKITSKTKAVIAVHLYGHIAPVLELQNICRDHNLYLIEDCAQAHLSEINGQYAGTFGDAAAFSFYPTKNLGAYGDAGCVITNSDELAEKIRRFANHGALQKEDHLTEGMNSRLDTLQAAVLLAKLPYLKFWNDKRNKNAQLYSQLLRNIPEITLPFVQRDTYHTFHLYVIRTSKRNELKHYLQECGIQTMIHYPKALPELPAYANLNISKDEFSVSRKLSEEVLSLPIFPELKEESIYIISDKIKELYNSQRRIRI